MYENLALLALFILLYSSIAARLERTPINGALVFTVVGFALGPYGLGLLQLDIQQEEGLRLLAELTLALVLFSDASNANLIALKRNHRLPERLLLIGLPLTIVLGFGIGILIFPGLGLLEIALLATMLAPTDAALGKAVVSDSRVPVNIREGLNVESGLNDGICVPLLFVFLTLAIEQGQQNAGFLALRLIVEEIGIGILVAFAVTLPGIWLIKHGMSRRWVSETWRQLPVISLAMACFASAQMLGGSGFIAAFVGGLLFDALCKDHKHQLLLAAEGSGDTLALLTWIIFGAAVIGLAASQGFSLNIILYALLSLTLIRLLPVYLALKGTGLTLSEKLFVGWFGPRGLASIVFILIVLDKSLPGSKTLALTVVCTIIFSVIAHGLTANPLVAALSAKPKEH